MGENEAGRSQEGPLLGINEVVELTGISAFTIRYYDKCGFFPDLIRGKRGVRSFSGNDVRQLKLVDALRRSGLSIEGIKYFVRLTKRGASGSADRLQILQTQTTALEYQIAEAQVSLEVLRREQVEVAGEIQSIDDKSRSESSNSMD